MNRRIFASLITTPEYIPGALALYHSLEQTRPTFPFVLFYTSAVSERVRPLLRRLEIRGEEIEDLRNPSPTRVGSNPNWDNTFAKLRLFGASQYSKIVYLDADMLVLRNIDILLQNPHLSAVNAGGMLPELHDWIMPNTGLLVIEPCDDEFNRILSSLGRLSVRDQSDQSFLHTLYPDWPAHEELHLDHGFNIFFTHLDAYHRLFGYSLPDATRLSEDKRHDVSVIHFVGPRKIWMGLSHEVREGLAYLPLGMRAVRMWASTYAAVCELHPGITPPISVDRIWCDS